MGSLNIKQSTGQHSTCLWSELDKSNLSVVRGLDRSNLSVVRVRQVYTHLVGTGL